MAMHKPGDLVWAKMKGFAPWPAMVLSQTDVALDCPSGKHPILFFGTDETGFLKPQELFAYLVNQKNFEKPKKIKGFNKAVCEIRAEAGLPPDPRFDDFSKTPASSKKKAKNSKNASKLSLTSSEQPDPEQADKNVSIEPGVEVEALPVLDEDCDRAESPRQLVIAGLEEQEPSPKAKTSVIAAKNVSEKPIKKAPKKSATVEMPSPQPPPVVLETTSSGRKRKPKVFADCVTTFPGDRVAAGGGSTGKTGLPSPAKKRNWKKRNEAMDGRKEVAPESAESSSSEMVVASESDRENSGNLTIDEESVDEPTPTAEATEESRTENENEAAETIQASNDVPAVESSSERLGQSSDQQTAETTSSPTRSADDDLRQEESSGERGEEISESEKGQTVEDKEPELDTEHSVDRPSSKTDPIKLVSNFSNLLQSALDGEEEVINGGQDIPPELREIPAAEPATDKEGNLPDKRKKPEPKVKTKPAFEDLLAASDKATLEQAKNQAPTSGGGRLSKRVAKRKSLDDFVSYDKKGQLVSLGSPAYDSSSDSKEKTKKFKPSKVEGVSVKKSSALSPRLELPDETPVPISEDDEQDKATIPEPSGDYSPKAKKKKTKKKIKKLRLILGGSGAKKEYQKQTEESRSILEEARLLAASAEGAEPIEEVSEKAEPLLGNENESGKEEEGNSAKEEFSGGENELEEEQEKKKVVKKKKKKRSNGRSMSPGWQRRRVDFPHHVKPKECEICGGVVKPQTGGSAGCYMMRCTNKMCRKWWGSIDGFGKATAPPIKPVSTAAQASNKIKRKAIASRRKKEQMQAELDLEDFERVKPKPSANATVKKVGGSTPSTTAPTEHAGDEEELDVTSISDKIEDDIALIQEDESSGEKKKKKKHKKDKKLKSKDGKSTDGKRCHACGSKCRKRSMFGKIRLVCANVKCGIAQTAEGPLLPSCTFCGARTRAERCKDRMRVRCASKTCRKYMPAESFPVPKGSVAPAKRPQLKVAPLKKKQKKKKATPKPIVVEDEDLEPCKFCGSATRSIMFKYKKRLQCTNETCLQLVETRGRKKPVNVDVNFEFEDEISSRGDENESDGRLTESESENDDENSLRSGSRPSPKTSAWAKYSSSGPGAKAVCPECGDIVSKSNLARHKQKTCRGGLGGDQQQGAWRPEYAASDSEEERRATGQQKGQRKKCLPLEQTQQTGQGELLCVNCGYTVRQKNPNSKFWRCLSMACKQWYIKQVEIPTECRWCRGAVTVESKPSGKKKYRCLTCRKWQKGSTFTDVLEGQQKVLTETLPQLSDIKGIRSPVSASGEQAHSPEFEETVEIELPSDVAPEPGSALIDIKKEQIRSEFDTKGQDPDWSMSEGVESSESSLSTDDEEEAMPLKGKGKKLGAPKCGKLRVKLGGSKEHKAQASTKQKPLMKSAKAIAAQNPAPFSKQKGGKNDGVQSGANFVPERKRAKLMAGRGAERLTESDSSDEDAGLPRSPSPLPDWVLTYKPGYIETKSRWWLSQKPRKRPPSPKKEFGRDNLDCAAAFRMTGRCLEQLGERLQGKPDDSYGAMDGSLDLLMDTLMTSLAPLLCLMQSTPPTDVMTTETKRQLWESCVVHMPTWQS